MKPKETNRRLDSWYGRIKSGDLKTCPVEDCGGTFEHDDNFTMYECQKCGWTDECQELQDLGIMNPSQGWPRVTRTCVVCGVSNDGMVMPMIEWVNCLKHSPISGHFVCRWREDQSQHMIECDCSQGKVGQTDRGVGFTTCPVTKR